MKINHRIFARQTRHQPVKSTRVAEKSHRRIINASTHQPPQHKHQQQHGFNQTMNTSMDIQRLFRGFPWCVLLNPCKHKKVRPLGCFYSSLTYVKLGLNLSLTYIELANLPRFDPIRGQTRCSLPRSWFIAQTYEQPVHQRINQHNVTNKPREQSRVLGNN
jgi:hypothetical protein